MDVLNTIKEYGISLKCIKSKGFSVFEPRWLAKDGELYRYGNRVYAVNPLQKHPRDGQWVATVETGFSQHLIRSIGHNTVIGDTAEDAVAKMVAIIEEDKKRSILVIGGRIDKEEGNNI